MKNRNAEDSKKTTTKPDHQETGGQLLGKPHVYVIGVLKERRTEKCLKK